MRRILLMLIVLLGCFALSSHPPEIHPVPVDAWVVFYQKGGFYSGRFNLEVNGRIVAKPFRTRRWFEVRVPAGELRLRTVNTSPLDDSKIFLLHVNPGERVYVEGVIEFDFMVTTLYLVKHPADEAKAEINRLKRDEKTLPFVDR